MATWASAANAVRQDLEGVAYADAAAQGSSPYLDSHFLRWAVDFVDTWSNRVRIEELTVDEITLANGTEQYALNSDFLAIDTVVYVDPTDSSEKEIPRVHPDDDVSTRDEDSDSVYGYYLWGYGDSFRIGFLPTPTVAATVKVRYYRLITRPTALSDTADIPNEWIPMIKEHFKMQAAIMDQLPQKAVLHERLMMQAYRRARSHKAEQEYGNLSWR